MKKIWKEFKEFAIKGNAVDLAVGVIIGAAFGGIVNSLVKDIIMPPVSLLSGGLDFSNKFVVLRVAKDGDGDFFDIIDGDAKAAVHGGEGLAAVDEVLAGAGAGAPIDELFDEFGRGLVLGARGADEPRDVFDDVLADSD